MPSGRIRLPSAGAMSTVHTTIAPSFGGGGGGGKRSRDGDKGRDRRRPQKPKPLDKLSMADFAPDGRIRQLLLLLLQTANLGNLPSGSLLTGTKQPRTLRHGLVVLVAIRPRDEAEETLGHPRHEDNRPLCSVGCLRCVSF